MVNNRLDRYGASSLLRRRHRADPAHFPRDPYRAAAHRGLRYPRHQDHARRVRMRPCIRHLLQTGLRHGHLQRWLTQADRALLRHKRADHRPAPRPDARLHHRAIHRPSMHPSQDRRHDLLHGRRLPRRGRDRQFHDSPGATEAGRPQSSRPAPRSARPRGTGVKGTRPGFRQRSVSPALGSDPRRTCVTREVTDEPGSSWG